MFGDGDGDVNGYGDASGRELRSERGLTVTGARRDVGRMHEPTPRLHHESLDSYQAAIAFLALAAKFLDQVPRGFGTITDQLRRSSLSIPLNLAEGYGKRTQADRARFYDIARGSAHECGALFDAARVLRIIDESDFTEGKVLLHRIVSMLVKDVLTAIP